ncbi:MAG: hypothetical protein ACI9SE_001353 [Neolewinella sp.]|jgi:hypothetical protein
MHMQPIKLVLLFILLVSSLSAQGFTAYGDKLTNVDPVTGRLVVDLGFTFPFVDGTPTNQVQVYIGSGSNGGSIVLPSAPPSWGTDLFGLSEGPPNIRLMYRLSCCDAEWYLRQDVGSTTLTAANWSNGYLGGAVGSSVSQMVFYPSGVIRVRYWHDWAGQQLERGVFEGGFAPQPNNPILDPAYSEDLSTSITAPILTAHRTIFEPFFAQPFDLSLTELTYTPVTQGWVIAGVYGLTPPVYPYSQREDLIPASFCEDYAEAKSITYTKTSTGYNVTRGPSLFDSNIGTRLGTAGSSVSSSYLAVDLGIPITFPDGNSHQIVDVFRGGVIAPAGQTTSNNNQLSANDIESSGYPFFFGLVVEWDNELVTPNTGIYSSVDTFVGFSTLTWVDMIQDDDGWTTPCTWQIRFYSNGDVVITHEDIAGLNPAAYGVSNDVAVGLTSGMPGGTTLDVSAIGSTPVSVSGYGYERWDVSSERCDLTQSVNYGSLDASDAILGETFSMQMIETQGATFGLYLLSVSGETNLNMTTYGSPGCLQIPRGDLISPQIADGLGNIISYSLAIPNNPALIDYEIIVQGAYDGITAPNFSGFAGLSFTLSFTNAIKLNLGLEAPF